MDYGSELGSEVPLESSTRAQDELDAISEDSFGSAPESPEPPVDCMWDNCNLQLSNPTFLGAHINHDHIPGAEAVECLWLGCKQRKVPQTSHDALVEHVRTHVGEKAYFCPVPECGKRFLKQESVFKHCTTVHEYNAHVQPDEGTRLPTLAGGGTLTKFWKYQPIKFHEEKERPSIEELEKQLKWASDLKDHLSSEYDALRRTKVAAWLDKEELLDKLISKELKDEEIDEILLLGQKTR